MNSADLKNEVAQAQDRVDELRKAYKCLSSNNKKELENFLIELEALESMGRASGKIKAIAIEFGLVHTPLREGEVRRTDTYYLNN